VTSNTTRPTDATASAEASCVDPRVARSRSAVLAAATELLVEAGPRAVTVDAVSERSGVAKSTLYRHWESRTALLIDVMSCNVPVVAPPDAALGFREALRTLVRSVASTLATAEWAALMPALMSLQQQVPELRRLSEADRERKVGALAAVLDLGVAEGVLPPGLDPALVATVVIGPVVFTVLGGGLADLDAVAEYTVERFLASYTA
jgi:AcrR family transcriptional regulator